MRRIQVGVSKFHNINIRQILIPISIQLLLSEKCLQVVLYFKDDTTFMTCAAESLQNDTVSVDPNYQPYVRYVQLVYYIFIFIFGLPLNWFVILLVIKKKALHTLSFAVAMQVVVLNVFIVSILVSLNIISLSADRWLFGEYVCAINGALNLLTYFTRIFLMLVLVLDHFMTVSIPYFYPKYRRKVVCTMSSIVWLLLGSYCIILLPGMLDCYAYLSFGYLCLATPSCSPVCNITLNIVSMLLIPVVRESGGPLLPSV